MREREIERESLLHSEEIVKQYDTIKWYQMVPNGN